MLRQHDLPAGAAAELLSADPTMTPAAVEAAIVNNATSGVVADAGPGSPNRLLYVMSNSTSGPAQGSGELAQTGTNSSAQAAVAALLILAGLLLLGLSRRIDASGRWATAFTIRRR